MTKFWRGKTEIDQKEFGQWIERIVGDFNQNKVWKR